VADADISDLAAFLGLAKGIGETEIRVSDHAENVGDPKRHESFDKHVADGADRARQLGQLDVDAVRTLLDRKARYRVAEPTRRMPADRVVVIAVPRAAEQALFD
jgi:hypothetical protein